MPKPPTYPDVPPATVPPRRPSGEGRAEGAFDPWASEPPRAPDRPALLPRSEPPETHLGASIGRGRARADGPRRRPTDSGLGAGVPTPTFAREPTGQTSGARDPGGRVGPRSDTVSFETRATVLSAPGVGDPAHAAQDEALDIVGRISSLGPPAAPPPIADPMGELRERYALGDFSGALTVAERLLEEDPANLDVTRYAESCREVLQQMYMARLGSFRRVPVVAVPAEKLRWLTLDHRAGFLLSHVDGVSTLEELFDVSGMKQLEAMRVIYELLQQRVVVLR